MKRIAFLSLIALLIVSACDKKDDNNPQPMEGTMTLNMNGLDNLGANYAYEGWIMVDGAPVSTGVFTVDDNGKLSKTAFSVSQSDLDKATAFILTIEPSPDNDPAPSHVHLMAGDFSGNNASLSINHGAALGTDFGNASGTYILATPTTTTTTDELSGIWFLDLSGGMPSVGLSLPPLPDGWKYEGWAVINGTPVTSGKFTAEDMADMSAPYSSNQNAGPPFPGEDYVMNAPAGMSFPTNLSGGKAVISVEPDPDNSPMPFTLKPLAGNIPADATDHMNYDMNMNANFPTGTATK